MDFDESLASGPHAVLAELVGRWKGSSTLWHRPGTPPDSVDDIELVVEPVTGGRVLQMTYASSVGEQATSGQLQFAYHLEDMVWQGTWSDTFHTGTQLLWLEGGEWSASRPPYLRGTYPAGDTRWGWAVSFELVDGDLVVIHENVPPGIDPVRALLWRCSRVD